MMMMTTITMMMMMMMMMMVIMMMIAIRVRIKAILIYHFHEWIKYYNFCCGVLTSTSYHYMIQYTLICLLPDKRYREYFEQIFSAISTSNSTSRQFDKTSWTMDEYKTILREIEVRSSIEWGILCMNDELCKAWEVERNGTVRICSQISEFE